ncbi:MAG: signal peptidase I [Candidatus Rifleibacteriota bacterium]
MNSIVHGLRDWFKDFLKALLFFLFLQTYVVQGFVIEGACMEPALHSHEKIIVNKLIYQIKEPSVGEVVVFSYPLETEKDFIKRVVGTPGDIIEIKDGYLFRNGKKMSEPFVPEYVFGSYGPVKVPWDKLCVMGDNRNNSHDSRSWGLLDRDRVKGRAELKFWPLESVGKILARAK